MQNSSVGPSNPFRILSASLYILLYHLSVLDRVLLEKVMSWSIALSSISTCTQFRLSLTYSTVVPRTTPDASVSRYNGFLTVEYVMHVAFFTSDLALSYISWYNLFQVQATLTEVSLLSGLNSSAVIGENILR